MGTRAVEAEIASARYLLNAEDSPLHRHVLALAESRLQGLLVHVSTPQRGTPFHLEMTGEDRGKRVREPVAAGWITASRIVLPAHDGLVTVLPRHAPMVGLLGSGQVIVTSRQASVPSPRFPDRTIEVPGAVDYRLFVSGGTFRVKDNVVLVLAERGFVPDRLILEDLENEADRRAVQAKVADRGLDGPGLHGEVLDGKRKEIEARRAELERESPSIGKRTELEKLRAMEKALD